MLDQGAWFCMIHNASNKYQSFWPKLTSVTKAPFIWLRKRGGEGQKLPRNSVNFTLPSDTCVWSALRGLKWKQKLLRGLTRTLGQVSRSTLALWEVRREQFSSPCCLSPPPSVYSKPNNETFDISLHAKERFKNLCMARGVRLMPRFVGGFVFQNFICTKSKQKW